MTHFISLILKELKVRKLEINTLEIYIDLKNKISVKNEALKS